MTVPDFEKILVDSSRALADLVVSLVEQDPDLMEELYRLAREKTGQLAMRSARAFDLADEAHPGLAAPWVPEIRQTLATLNHPSVVRCFLRTLTRYPLPEDEDELGWFYDYCMKLVADRQQAIAIRYYGMHFVYQTAFLLPDLRFELLPLFDGIRKEEGSGLKNRASNFSRMLEKKFGRE